MAEGTCSVDGCDGPAWVKSLCRRCYKRAEYLRNRDRYLRAAAQWAAANPERSRELKREHERRKRIADPGAVRARGRESMAKWRALNLEAARAKGRADYVRHRDKNIARAVQWAKDNPERFRAIQRNREIRERNAPGRGVSHDEWQEILRVHRYECFYCERRDVVLQLEHVRPLARGGRHDISNVVPACPRCNQRKATMTGREFLWRVYGRRRTDQGRGARRPAEGAA